MLTEHGQHNKHSKTDQSQCVGCFTDAMKQSDQVVQLLGKGNTTKQAMKQQTNAPRFRPAANTQTTTIQLKHNTLLFNDLNLKTVLLAIL